ncbi:dTMP kinase [Longispora sp. NPDC051575]|uniref:dTMP kinase n=1 Tax=Longispora sp. NPDC051575 TaxID=3154943 RepID=UPI00341B7ED8
MIGPLFIAIEGPNGVGKTTVAGLLADALAARTGRRAHLTSEPTRSELGQLVRRTEATLQGRALALALAADRAEHVDGEILEMLNAGLHVITDRYVPSSLVLQRVDGLDLDEIWSYNKYFLPTITFYLIDDPDVITGRLGRRASLSRLEMTGGSAKELRFYAEAREFLVAEDWRQHEVDCQGRTPQEVTETILSLLKLTDSH